MKLPSEAGKPDALMFSHDIQGANQPATRPLRPLPGDGGVQNPNHKRIQENTNAQP